MDEKNTSLRGGATGEATGPPYFVTVGGEASGHAYKSDIGAPAPPPLGSGLYTPPSFGVCSSLPFGTPHSHLFGSSSYPVSSSPDGGEGLPPGCVAGPGVYIPGCSLDQAANLQTKPAGFSEHQRLSCQVGAAEPTQQDAAALADFDSKNSPGTTSTKEEKESAGSRIVSDCCRRSVTPSAETVFSSLPEPSCWRSGQVLRKTLETGESREEATPALHRSQEESRLEALAVCSGASPAAGQKEGGGETRRAEGEEGQPLADARRTGPEGEGRRENADEKRGRGGSEQSEGEGTTLGAEDDGGKRRQPGEFDEKKTGGEQHGDRGRRRETGQPSTDETEGEEEEGNAKGGWLVALDAEFVAAEEILGDLTTTPPPPVSATAGAPSSPLLHATPNSGHASSLALARCGVLERPASLAVCCFTHSKTACGGDSISYTVKIGRMWKNQKTRAAPPCFFSGAFDER